MKNRGSIESALFEALLSLESEDERDEFIALTCQGDPDLRARLKSLLYLCERSEDYFDLPPPKMPVPMDHLALIEGEEGAHANHASALAGSGASIGHYKLRRRLGEGGYGVVYEAEQLEPVQRLVALKIIRLGMDTAGMVARFNQERQASAMMDHPNIARVLDAGATTTGRPYFVMELVAGEPITRFCSSADLALADRLNLFVQVCMAIQHAHQKGVIHRDIKPSNILVSRVDGLVVPKVIDFGVAKAIGEQAALNMRDVAEGQIVGTLTYMSPEQASGNCDIDTRSDIYSLGVLLLEIIFGPPSSREQCGLENGSKKARRIAGVSSSTRVTANLARHGKELEWIIAKAMSENRSERYETAAGLAADVQRLLDCEPVMASPKGGSYRVGKLIRRNKVRVGVGALCITALLVVAGVSNRLYLTERKSKEEQSRLRAVAEIARANEARLRKDAEARGLISQAAMQIVYRNLPEADRLLRSLPSERTPSSLEAAKSFETVGNWHLFEGRWKEAARCFSSQARAISIIDTSDRDSVSSNLLPAAAALGFVGDVQEYERIRMLALGRFAQTEHPIVAEQLLKVCLLKPADDSVLGQLRPLASILQVAIDQKGSAVSVSEHQTWWSCFAMALFHFREGNQSAAGEWALRCRETKSLSEIRNCSVNILSALIEYAAGDSMSAKTRLSQVSDKVVEKTTSLPVPGGSEQGYWHTWIIARILLEEARNSIGEP